MRKLLGTVIFAAGLLTAGIVVAAEKTVTLKVLGMSCASCSYMVKESLAAVDGVKSVSVSMIEKKAEVTYDNAKSKVDELIKAVEDSGFLAEYDQQGG